MAGLPGSPASRLPAGDDELVRRMRDIERRMDELGPSTTARLAEKVRTYRRVFTHAELTDVGTSAYPLWDLTLSCAAPFWATSGTVLAYTFPAWTGTLALDQYATLVAFPVSMWNSNAPVEGGSAKIYYETGSGGYTTLLRYAAHSHPVEVKGGSGFPTTDLLTNIRWVRSTSFPASGVTITLDTVVLWN